mgnify:CR=1 FL=1
MTSLRIGAHVDQADPLAEAGEGAALAVGLDGTVVVTSTEERTVTTLAPRATEFRDPVVADLPGDAGSVSEVTTVGGRYIFHHMTYQSGVLNEEGTGLESEGRQGWPIHEVGRNPDVFPEGLGMLLQANSALSLSASHLHSTGWRETTGRLEFGFRLLPFLTGGEVAFLAAGGHDRLIHQAADAGFQGHHVAVAGAQKGLMTPPGLSFVAAGDKALAARKHGMWTGGCIPLGYDLVDIEPIRIAEGSPDLEVIPDARGPATMKPRAVKIATMDAAGVQQADPAQGAGLTHAFHTVAY